MYQISNYQKNILQINKNVKLMSAKRKHCIYIQSINFLKNPKLYIIYEQSKNKN